MLPPELLAETVNQADLCACGKPKRPYCGRGTRPMDCEECRVERLRAYGREYARLKARSGKLMPLTAKILPPADPNRESLKSLFEREGIVTIKAAAKQVGMTSQALRAHSGGMETYDTGFNAVFCRLEDAARVAQWVKSYRRRNGIRHFGGRGALQTRAILLRCDLSALSERSRDMLERYYGLADREMMTLDKIGDLHGLSRERVRQLVSGATARVIHTALDKVLPEMPA